MLALSRARARRGVGRVSKPDSMGHRALVAMVSKGVVVVGAAYFPVMPIAAGRRAIAASTRFRTCSFCMIFVI
jgi:hypothetical protein